MSFTRVPVATSTDWLDRIARTGEALAGASRSVGRTRALIKCYSDLDRATYNDEIDAALSTVQATLRIDVLNERLQAVAGDFAEARRFGYEPEALTLMFVEIEKVADEERERWRVMIENHLDEEVPASVR